MGKPPRQTKKERLKMKRERLESERKLKSQLKQTTSPSNKQESFDTDTIQQNVLEMKKRVCILKENYKKWKEGVSANCNLVDVGLHFVGHNSGEYNSQREKKLREIKQSEGKLTSFEKQLLHVRRQGVLQDQEKSQNNLAKKIYWGLNFASNDGEFMTYVQEIKRNCEKFWHAADRTELVIVRKAVGPTLVRNEEFPGCVDSLKCYHIAKNEEYQPCDCLNFELSQKSKQLQLDGKLVENNLILKIQSIAVSRLKPGEHTPNFYLGFVREFDPIVWERYYTKTVQSFFFQRQY